MVDNARASGEESENVEGQGSSDEAAPRKGKKKLIIIGAAIAILAGGGAGAFFTGLADPVVALVAGGAEHSEEAGGHEAAAKADPIFYELPEFVVNLNTTGRRPTYLKIRTNLEIQSRDDILRIEEQLPRITDSFQVYLRELRLEDIKGSAGMYRLREELLRRVSIAVAPVQVNDVLFVEMFIH
ncbi:MAG: flagellar basal body-associated FliL family protein [Rhodospirillales bacterium]|nr:flagellar basal body-associated FliL family protein [Rhodospirillales bacterium]